MPHVDPPQPADVEPTEMLDVVRKVVEALEPLNDQQRWEALRHAMDVMKLRPPMPAQGRFISLGMSPPGGGLPPTPPNELHPSGRTVGNRMDEPHEPAWVRYAWWRRP